MSKEKIVADLVTSFKTTGRIVIVGASLAGLRAAEALRDESFTGKLTIIGDEPHEPYDRPPLSKQVLTGLVPAGNTTLPRLREVDADWRLGVAATGLDRKSKTVKLANGDEVPYDRLLIATGVRSRPWFNPTEAALDGVFTLRTSDDAGRLQSAFAAKPGRVLIVGAGFIGSEIASVCRELGLDVTVAERAAAPLIGALGGVIGKIAAEMHSDNGVDLRTGVSVEKLEGDDTGHVRRARLSDGTTLDVDVVVASLGSLRNIEWLEGAGLATGFWGVACDAGCRAFDINGVVTDSIFVAGDIARFPHVLYEYQFLSLEFWLNAYQGAAVAAHNMVSLEPDRRPHLPLPGFWSSQFGVDINGVGIPSFGDEVVITQGSVKERRFAAAFGRRGRIVGAVTFNDGNWLDYGSQIERSAPFPPPPGDEPTDMKPVPAEFPDRRTPTALPTVVLTGHDPTDRVARFETPPLTGGQELKFTARSEENPDRRTLISEPTSDLMEVGRLDDIEPGKRKYFRAGKRGLAIFNIDGTIYAIDEACAHAGSSLISGRLQGTTLTCPAHGFRFNVTTGCMAGTKDPGVASHPVTIVDGKVMVALPAQPTRSA